MFRDLNSTFFLVMSEPLMSMSRPLLASPLHPSRERVQINHMSWLIPPYCICTFRLGAYLADEMPYAQGVRKILPDPHMGFYCVQTAVWLVYHYISFYIGSSVNFPNFRTGQYFPNTLYILMYICISMYMHF